MMSASAATQAWLESFGWPVYGAEDVPAGAQVPYITYTLKEPSWDQKTGVNIQLWAYKKDNTTLMYKADEICAAIFAGVRIPCDGGLVVLWPDNPLQQVIRDGNYRRVLILCSENAYHCPGV